MTPSELHKTLQSWLATSLDWKQVRQKAEIVCKQESIVPNGYLLNTQHVYYYFLSITTKGIIDTFYL
jgi:hypothetical protein